MSDRVALGVPLSGRQYTLRSGDYEATIASVGATLRTLTHAGRNLILPFPAEQMRPEYRGAILAPWPNRTTDGTYVFNGSRQQLPINDPGLGHALHGLVHWLDFTTVSATNTRVDLAVDLQAQDGYPFRVKLAVRYLLTQTGLSTTVTVTNTGSTPAPFGVGAHPYLVAGPGTVDDWELELPATQALQITADRLIPLSVVHVGELALDFTQPRALRGEALNHAFTGLTRTDGHTTVRVIHPATGTGVGMSVDASIPWIQAYSADMPGRAARRRSLAIEPMTCPPDALNSRIDLWTLPPTHSRNAQWCIFSL